MSRGALVFSVANWSAFILTITLGQLLDAMLIANSLQTAFVGGMILGAWCGRKRNN